jgi:hypothetical protein
LLEAMEAVAHTAVPNVAADADAHPAEQLRIDDKLGCEVAAVFAFEVGQDRRGCFGRKLGRRLDGGRPLFHFEAEQALISFEDLDVMARLLFDQRFDERRDPTAIELAVDKAPAKEFLRKLPRLLVDLHGPVVRKRSGATLLPGDGADLRR